MSLCKQCNAPLPEYARYCNSCGYPVSEEVALREEQEFLNTTHRLLRWEQKAWRICGIVMLALGIFFVALYSLFGIIGLFSDGIIGTEAAGLFAIFFMYAMFFGGIFIAVGIVGKISSKKISPYLDTMHLDLLKTVNRSGNVGMLVIAALFGEVAFIFFLINFIRIKSNPALIQRIINRQQTGI